METLKLPQNILHEQFNGCAKLRDIIVRLEDSAKQQGKVVCRVTVNGLVLSEADEERFATTEFGDIQDIEVELESVDVLVRGTISSLREYVADIHEASLDAAEQFREGQRAEAGKIFLDIVNCTRWLTDALLAVKGNWLHWSSLRVGDEAELAQDWAENEAHMMATVRELLSAYESQDFVLVSDVLEYELSTTLERWLKLLDLD